jgi:triosephosphate isomerase
MRKNIVAGNWKMNTNLQEAAKLVNHLKEKVHANKSGDTKVILCPPFTHLKTIGDLIENTNIELGAQNIYPESNGAFTGEISAEMLISSGCNYVIIGHSERREYFNEDNDFLAKKIKFTLENNLVPIFCCGERLEEREENTHFEIITEQVISAIDDLSEAEMQKVIIAYEPVWAIGTGKTASPEQAQEIHAFIRQLIAERFNEEIAESISILYGGSVKPANAKELFGMEDIDGGLIGGASLNAEDFYDIITSF